MAHVKTGLKRYGVDSLQDEVTGLKCSGTKRIGAHSTHTHLRQNIMTITVIINETAIGLQW